MITTKQQNWKEANKNYLIASMKIVKEELEFYSKKDNTTRKGNFEPTEVSLCALESAKKALPGKAAIEKMCETFALSSFEEKILLMCAGVELMSDFGEFIGKLQGHNDLVHPTFNLAMTFLSGASWDAISPSSSLRQWNLINIKNGSVLAKSKLMIEEPILHYLTGVTYLDKRLETIVAPIHTEINLAPSQIKLIDDITHSCIKNQELTTEPIILLESKENADDLAIASGLAKRNSNQLFRWSVHAIPNNYNEIRSLTQLWNREAFLNDYGLFLDARGLNEMDPIRIQFIISFINNIRGLLIMRQSEWASRLDRPQFIFTVNKPTRFEQLTFWKKVLGKEGEPIHDYLQDIVAHFDLCTKTISEAGKEIKSALPKEETPEYLDDFKSLIWQTCCKHTRPKVDGLAQLVKPIASWKDIVLPETQIETLREIANQVKNRGKVYDEWGFANKSSRGLGISALFTGESGTGKTMAAEVLANELNLDLYRIDLSQVVNKYIGETEKNLKRIFDAAEEGGAILLFDEADALFGKRSEVKDSHDRYSNIEVGYLLQRMEEYKGLAVLTTNMKNAIDDAFLRRIRFVIHFIKPDVEHIAAIWKNVFPEKTKVGKFDYSILSRLNLAGGNINNIALNAAFRAANGNGVVQMPDVVEAIIGEYKKIEQIVSRVDLQQLRMGVWKSFLESKSNQLDYSFLSRLNIRFKDIKLLANKTLKLASKKKERVGMSQIITVLSDPSNNLSEDVLKRLEHYKSLV